MALGNSTLGAIALGADKTTMTVPVPEEAEALTGSIVTLASTQVPVGYLECDGAAINRTDYAELFDEIGTTFGAGNGSTTFNIPDLRGEFIRGWANTSGVDAGRVFGSKQSDELESHAHSLLATRQQTDGWDEEQYEGVVPSTNTTHFQTNAVGGSETRPRNIALMYCIKHGKKTVPVSTGAPGFIVTKASTSIPDGHLECDGSAISRNDYSALFAEIGTTFGSGNGTTTFNIPDLRGEFIRGWANTSGVDAGRAFGSSQTDEFESHAHSLLATRQQTDGWDEEQYEGVVPSTNTTHFQTNAVGGGETRPRNVAMVYCITY